MHSKIIAFLGFEGKLRISMLTCNSQLMQLKPVLQQLSISSVGQIAMAYITAVTDQVPVDLQEGFCVTVPC